MHQQGAYTALRIAVSVRSPASSRIEPVAGEGGQRLHFPWERLASSTCFLALARRVVAVRGNKMPLAQRFSKRH